MRTGKSLMELAAEIERQAKTKQDWLVPLKTMEMTPEGTLHIPVPKAEPLNLNVNELAHRQIGSYTGIPAPYYDKLLAAAPHLLAENVNHWLHADEDVRMVRTLDGNVRAFLSNGFRPLENVDLARAALPALGGLGVEIVSSEITERRLYIKAVDRRVVRQVDTGRIVDGSKVGFDELFPTITISNSEVGSGSLMIETGAFTHACKNMMIFRERSMRKYHVGKKHELVDDSMVTMLSDRTRALTDAALWSQVGDVVKGAFNPEQFGNAVKKLSVLTEQKIEGKVEEAVEVTAKKFGFNDGEQEDVLKHLIEGGDLSRYGLLNAITRTAEDRSDYDRATAFERFGGEIIDLSPKEWKEIATAA